MKVVIINKSDSVGGAAVVSRRLLYALRDRGVDARMLVTDRHIDSPCILPAGSPTAIMRAFLAERLKIFAANGFDRRTLFKIDSASDGLPLSRNRAVQEADVICLNWVNQGVLSLHGVEELLQLGKPVVWTMHDMWNFTGICHHAGKCRRWERDCGDCPLLGRRAGPHDLSRKVWAKKAALYALPRKIHFVAVSNWLAQLARESSLMGDARISVIPNAFPVPETPELLRRHDVVRTSDSKVRVVIGAARLDDPVKGLPILVEATKVLRDRYPEQAERLELVTFGNIKKEGAVDGLAIAHRHLGTVQGEENVRNVYLDGDIVLSTSLYETFGATLVEGQVYGCIPVTFGRGGQTDIVDHLETGYVADWSDDVHEAAQNIARGIVWAVDQLHTPIRERMFKSARDRFSAAAIADRYIELFKKLLDS